MGQTVKGECVGWDGTYIASSTGEAGPRRRSADPMYNNILPASIQIYLL